MARFGTANEHGDWETAHHAFTYANAVHQGLERIGIGPDGAGWPEAVRGVLHGAMAVYLGRYLNVPPARLPGEAGDRWTTCRPTPRSCGRRCWTRSTAASRSTRRGGWSRATCCSATRPGRWSRRWRAPLLREDAGFHACQMLEAGVRQHRAWGDTDQGRHVLVAVARYLAAHSPTERTTYQTADIARRLMRGARLHEEAGAAG